MLACGADEQRSVALSDGAGRLPTVALAPQVYPIESYLASNMQPFRQDRFELDRAQGAATKDATRCLGGGWFGLVDGLGSASTQVLGHGAASRTYIRSRHFRGVWTGWRIGSKAHCLENGFRDSGLSNK